MKFIKLLITIFLFMIFQPVHAQGLELIKKHNIRIPGTCNVHSVNGIYFSGRFILAYQSSADFSIYITQGTPDNWQTPFVLASSAEIGMNGCECFDPVLFQADGKIYVFYRVGKNPRDWHGFFKVSLDDGVSWSSPIGLPENILGPAKCRPLISEDGNSLICGCSFQRVNADVQPKFKERSGQDGWVSIDIWDFKNTESEVGHWTKGIPLAYEFGGAGSVVIQPAIWQDVSNPQMLHMLCRSNTGKLVYACSLDFGKNWINVCNSELPSNYSAIDVLNIGNRVFMAWNPILGDSTKSTSFSRWKLVVSELIGKDPLLSESWKDALVLECDEPGMGNFSYPCIIFCPDMSDRLFVAYGRNGSELILAEVSLLSDKI